MRPPATPALFQPGRATRGAGWHGRGRCAHQDTTKTIPFRRAHAPAPTRRRSPVRVAPRLRPSLRPRPRARPQRCPKRHAERARTCMHGSRPGQRAHTNEQALVCAVGAWGSHCARTAHPSLPWPRPNTAIARSCKAPRAHGLEGRDIRQGRTDPDQSLRFWCKALKRHGFLRAPTRMDWCNGPYSTPPARQRAALARCQMCRIPCRGTG